MFVCLIDCLLVCLCAVVAAYYCLFVCFCEYLCVSLPHSRNPARNVLQQQPRSDMDMFTVLLACSCMCVVCLFSFQFICLFVCHGGDAAWYRAIDTGYREVNV